MERAERSQTGMPENQMMKIQMRITRCIIISIRMERGMTETLGIRQ